MGKNTVIKIGGSLIKEAPELMQHIVENSHLFESQISFIPGGGPFADFIRKAENKLDLKSDSAHWMAILAMEQYGHYLAEKSGIPTTISLENNQNHISILLPYSFLIENDPLTHSWEVTSDTIAAFFAVHKNADFIKVTDVDGVLVDEKLVDQINTVDLAKMGETCADLSFPDYLNKNKLDCFVTNGKFPNRLLEYLQDKNTIGTLIKGNI